jgi:hypothetical protein
MGILDRLLGKPSIDNFAAQMIRALHAAGEQSELRFDATERRIVKVHGSDHEWLVNLDDIYPTYLAQPRGKRAEYIRSTAIALLTPRKGLPKDFDLARADLRPRLWVRAMFEQMRLHFLATGLGVEPQPPPSQPIGEHLIATLA